jgi:hypothetical protein
MSASWPGGAVAGAGGGRRGGKEAGAARVAGSGAGVLGSVPVVMAGAW